MLIKNRFEEYAREQGFSNGAELFEYVTGNLDAYEKNIDEVPLCRAALRALCWEIGFSEITDFIRFETNEITDFRDIVDSF